MLRLLLCSFLKLTLKPDRTDIYRAVETSALRLLEDPVARTKIFVCADELHEYFIRELRAVYVLGRGYLHHDDAGLIHVSVIKRVVFSDKGLALVHEKLLVLRHSMSLQSGYSCTLFFDSEIILNHALQQLVSVQLSHKTAGIVVGGDICRILRKDVANYLADRIVPLFVKCVVTST